MKTWRELTIASRNMDARSLVEALRAFCAAEAEWAFAEEMSLDYSQDCGRPACMIEGGGGNRSYKPTIALESIGSRTGLELVNIWPGTMDECNCAVARFATAFRRWVKRTGSDAIVKLGRTTDIELEQLISSRTARGLFKSYLDKCRLKGGLAKNPPDLELLDRFTCALHTYSRKPVCLDDLKRYLREDCLWSESDATWCVQRIEIGRDVLRVYKPRMSDRRWHRPS